MPATSRKPLVAGNWKMNGLREQLGEVDAVRKACSEGHSGHAEIVLCPPATLVAEAVRVSGGTFAIGAQDCHPEAAGAHTGDIAAEMLTDVGAAYVILGHSERRADHGEDDALVASKLEAARRAGLTAILCVGETRDEREAGRTLEVVGAQLAGSIPVSFEAESLVIAYEPVWAIGTGLTPETSDVAEAHGFIRVQLRARFGAAAEGIRILYGGSVKPDNAAELMAVPDVDGALVGGASLKAADFMAIASVYCD